jgi:hypothetical protein
MSVYGVQKDKFAVILLGCDVCMLLVYPPPPPILFIGTIRKRLKSLLWYVQAQRCLNIQVLRIFGTDQNFSFVYIWKVPASNVGHEIAYPAID